MDGVLFQVFIYLCAAVIAVPLAKRLGLGSVLGYLIAGVIIGPVIGLVGAETQQLQHFAEFGVVMMLFLVGLELEPRALWDMRQRLLGLGGLQVVLTGAAITAVAMLLGLSWSVALVVGLVLSLSSTAIVLQTLTEKGLMKSPGGEASFSVLLFQDIAVIPMLALIPLLVLPELAGTAGGHAASAGHAQSFNLVAGLAGWQTALVTLGAIALVIVGGHYLSLPLFRYIAAARLREIFTAAALLLVVAIALLMTMVGLSPALGTFLAGVVLANSEFRHELESDIEPFKGLLLGLFFITVGAGIDFDLLFANSLSVFGMTAALIFTKGLVLLVLAILFKVRGADRWLLALGLAQAGEFGFVLLSFSVSSAALPAAVAATLALVVALSMLLTPALFILLDRVIIPRFNQTQQRPADHIAEPGVAIIAGLGRFGQVVNRVLLANGHKTVVLDHRAELIEGMRRFGIRTYFGDASRPDLLHAAGLSSAQLIVIAIDDPQQAVLMVEHIRRERPAIRIVVRARDRQHVYQLYSAGADDIVREMFDSSVRAARYALEALGSHPFDAEKATTTFVDQDALGLRRLAAVWDPAISVYDNAAYVTLAKEISTELEAAMLGDRSALHDRTDRGWTPPGVARSGGEKS